MSIVQVQDDRCKWLVAAYLIVFVLAAALRVAGIDRQGLWADEAFSLAMATGHSLEHSASVANPSQGDYVESSEPRPAIEYKKYLEHKDPPADIEQVLRAVQLSDTSPPIYYLLLWAWTRLSGTSDAALRFFSVLWALACFPFIYLLAKEIGGKSAILPALVLFSLSPLSIYYSTEGRMYSMLWFLALCFAWLSLRLHQRGPRPFILLLWILVASAGMLTHYFYAFVGAACFLWLLIYPGQFSRGMSLAAVTSIGLCILPWYVKLPQLFSSWHVTGNWLFMPAGDRAVAALKLPWSLISFTIFLRREYNQSDFVILSVLILVVMVSLLRAGWRCFSSDAQLLLLWVLASCLGPFVFDLVLNSYVTLEPRYALPGMPAALLLLACGLGRLPAGWRYACVLLILFSWLPHFRYVTETPWRYWEPYRQVANALDNRAHDSDVLVIHSTPTGVACLARYLTTSAKTYTWVGQLRQRRVPDDIQNLAEQYKRIVLVKIHVVAEPAPEETWLREHLVLSEELQLVTAEILIFDTGKAKPEDRLSNDLKLNLPTGLAMDRLRKDNG